MKKFLLLIAIMMLASPFFAIADDARTEIASVNDDIYEFPLTYREKPIGFSEFPPGWREKPLGFREKPIQWTDRPSGFLERIYGTLEIPRGFSPTPPNFIEKDSHPQGNFNEDYLQTPDNHPLVDVDPAKRISPDLHPDATTVESIAEKKSELGTAREVSA